MGAKRPTSFFLTSVVAAATLLAVVALASPHVAEAYDWSLATVDAAADVTSSSSIAVDANGDPMVSYQDATSYDLKFAICDASESANGNCDRTADWSTVTVDAEADVAFSTSLVLNASGDAMISYRDAAGDGLKFAMCDLSESANGNCDQPGDWSTVTVDVEADVADYTSVAVNADGDPMISYFGIGTDGLKFAICDLSESANGNCDQPADWTTAALGLAVPG
jgi:hypothetical protein